MHPLLLRLCRLTRSCCWCVFAVCGTLHYMSPEMIQYSGHGKGSDWWALGALLHEMLTGSTPFSGNNRKVIQDNILTAPLKLPKWMDNPTKSILTELLRRPISKRLGCGPDGAAAIKVRGTTSIAALAARPGTVQRGAECAACLLTFCLVRVLSVCVR